MSTRLIDNLRRKWRARSGMYRELRDDGMGRYLAFRWSFGIWFPGELKRPESRPR